MVFRRKEFGRLVSPNVEEIMFGYESEKKNTILAIQ
jgi:hypothetical protein